MLASSTEGGAHLGSVALDARCAMRAMRDNLSADNHERPLDQLIAISRVISAMHPSASLLSAFAAST